MDLPDECLDVGERVAESFAGEAHGVARGAGAGGSTDAVDVVLRVPGQIVVEDVAHVRNVQPAGRDVGCEQNGQLAARLKRSSSLKGAVFWGTSPVSIPVMKPFPASHESTFSASRFVLKKMIVRVTSICSQQPDEQGNLFALAYVIQTLVHRRDRDMAPRASR